MNYISEVKSKALFCLQIRHLEEHLDVSDGELKWSDDVAIGPYIPSSVDSFIIISTDTVVGLCTSYILDIGLHVHVNYSPPFTKHACALHSSAYTHACIVLIPRPIYTYVGLCKCMLYRLYMSIMHP